MGVVLVGGARSVVFCLFALWRFSWVWEWHNATSPPFVDVFHGYCLGSRSSDGASIIVVDNHESLRIWVPLGYAYGEVRVIKKGRGRRRCGRRSRFGGLGFRRYVKGRG